MLMKDHATLWLTRISWKGNRRNRKLCSSHFPVNEEQLTELDLPLAELARDNACAAKLAISRVPMGSGIGR